MNESFKSVIDRHADELHAIEGVISVAEGTDNGKPCILVFLSKNDKVSKEKIREILEGYPVDIEITDEATLTD